MTVRIEWSTCNFTICETVDQIPSWFIKEKQGNIKIKFCKGNQSLGQANSPLLHLCFWINVKMGAKRIEF